MATNNFKPFGIGSGANVTSQADYEGLPALASGFQSGKASSSQINKAIRQSTVIASALAQYIANTSGKDVLDNGDTSTILNNLLSSIQATSKSIAISSMAGVIGSSRNSKMSISTASASATFTSDEITVGTAIGGSQYRIGNFSKTVNLTTLGAGGMDTGAAPVNGFVALYAIYNPTSGASSLLAVNATASVAPEVYGGSNMPSGFTASALVSVWATDSSSKLIPGYQFQRAVRTTQITALDSTSTPTSATALNISSAVPKNASSCFIYARSRASAGTGSIGFALSADSSGIGRTAGGIYIGTGQASVSYDSAAIPIQMITPQTIYYYTTINGPTAYQFTIYCSGYEF